MRIYYCDVCDKEINDDKLIAVNVKIQKTGEFIGEIDLCPTCYEKILMENEKYKTEEYEIITAPDADVREVKHGKWVVSGTFDDFLKCSICGFDSVMFTANEFNYCPICGAKMDAGDSKEKIDDTDSKASV